MKLTAKHWAGIATSVILILLFLIQHPIGNEPMTKTSQMKYYRVRIKITWQLMNLRQECAAQKVDVAQNMVLEIRQLWDDRDMLYYALHKRPSPFPSDSLLMLEHLIDQQVPLKAVFREIDRVAKVNETN